MKRRHALVLGATGLVGSSLVRILLEKECYEKITILVRKKVNMMHQKLEQVEIDFEQLAMYGPLFAVDDVYSCLGTTIKQAKTREAFEKVDYTYTLQAAQLAAAYGAQFAVISSMGADEKSMFFYSRVKGVVERDLKTLPLPTLHIVRPSLLVGERSDERFGEKMAERFSRTFPFLFRGPLQKYAPITAERVAAYMCNMMLTDCRGIFIHESQKMNSYS